MGALGNDYISTHVEVDKVGEEIPIDVTVTESKINYGKSVGVHFGTSTGGESVRSPAYDRRIG